MTDERRRTILGVEVQVLVLGLVSFLTDVSSELIFSVLPIFVTGVLRGSPLVLGLMEGLADFAASSLDVLSGWLSDRTGKKKAFAALGYGLSTVAKALLLLATSAWHVVLFRIVERLGKSVRGAPRDALLASVSPDARRGTSFGVHKALDRAGAVVGPLVAWYVLGKLGPSLETFRELFRIAFTPAVLGVLVLLLLVRERPGPPPRALSLGQSLGALGGPYRRYLAAASLFSLAYFSFGFLLLNAVRVGFEVQEVPLLYALLNVTVTVVSIPIGVLADRLGRRAIVGTSFAVYEALLVLLLLAPARWAVVAGFVAYGVFVAIDESQTKAYLSDLSTAEHRATAIGLYNFVTGLAYVPASAVAGALWEHRGPEATFGFAAVVTLAAGIVFALSPRPVPAA